MEKRKILITLAAFMMAGGLLAGCSSGSSGSSASSSSKTAANSSSSTTSFKKNSTNDAKKDPSLSTTLKETQSKFKQYTYKDSKTGVSLKYNLYVPTNYNKKTSYPLVSFIHDDSITGKSTTASLTQGYGGVIWATPSEQAKHASFVFVPTFSTSTISGGMNQFGSSVVKKNVQTYLDLLSNLESKYNINKNRLYGTGQSMGGMTMFYLNSHYPKLFAATLYVASQWETNQLSALKNQKFFYIVAGGDSTASTGQKDLMAMLDKDKVSYTHQTLSAQSSDAKKNQVVNQMISQNKNANFITWTKGSVLSGIGQTMEHMASFNYGYTIPSVRDWLFNQSK